MLFIIFINDLDCEIVSWLLKFADDNFGTVRSTLFDIATRSVKIVQLLGRMADVVQHKPEK